MSKFSNTQIDEMKAHLPEYAEEMLSRICRGNADKIKGQGQVYLPVLQQRYAEEQNRCIDDIPNKFLLFFMR